MKTSGCAGALLLGAVILGGCAASPVQGAQMRVHTTTAAFVQDGSARAQTVQHSKLRTHKGSPLLSECKSGSSKSCGELGDRLTIKYAYAEAHQWYAIACGRVSNAMVPTATRLVQLSQDLKRVGSSNGEDEDTNAANRQRALELKNEASELRARIKGCFDAGDALKLESDLKESLTYYDTVCEFSTLIETVGEAVPGLEHVTESGCTAGQAVRARLNSKSEFTPELFAELVEQQARTTAAKQSATQSEQGMVFNEADL